MLPVNEIVIVSYSKNYRPTMVTYWSERPLYHDGLQIGGYSRVETPRKQSGMNIRSVGGKQGVIHRRLKHR